MTTLRKTLLAATSVVFMVGAAQAQSPSPDTQAEMNRGVPGVDVDVGRNADGVIDVNRENSEMARGVPGVDVDVGRNASGAVDVDVDDRAGANNRNLNSRTNRDDGSTTARAPRSDRN